MFHNGAFDKGYFKALAPHYLLYRAQYGEFTEELYEALLELLEDIVEGRADLTQYGYLRNKYIEHSDEFEEDDCCNSLAGSLSEFDDNV